MPRSRPEQQRIGTEVEEQGMPIYHFHNADGVRWVDEGGCDLPDDEAARRMAMRIAGEMLMHDTHELWRHGHWRVEVTDEDNVLLFTIAVMAMEAPRRGAIAAG